MNKLITLLTLIFIINYSTAQQKWPTMAKEMDNVKYIGALDTAMANDWTKGWANWDPKNATYGAATDTSALNGRALGSLELTGTVTLDASKVYLLQGLIIIKSGGKLIIPAGTIIRCKSDLNANPKNYGTLVVERGGQIEINGTKNAPVVFTSYKSSGRDRGDWGGIVICGNSPNNQGADVQVEGFNNVAFNTNYAKYGGTNETDNSGKISYCRIEFGGFAFEPNKEVNGLTLASVGSGTAINFVQVSYSGDDSYEWFGGSVNCKGLIAYKGTDDDFDTDFGYHGYVQFGIAQKDTNYYDLSWNVAGGSTSEGFESDNDAAGSGKRPLTTAIFSNMTMVGPVPINGTWAGMGSTPKGAFRRGARIRRNSRLSIINSIFMGYRNFLMIDGDSTYMNNGIKDSTFSEAFLYRNNLISNSAAALTPATTTANGLIETSNAAYLSKITNYLNSPANGNWVNTAAHTTKTVLVDPQNLTAPDFRPVANIANTAKPKLDYSRIVTTWGLYNSIKKITALSNVSFSPNPTNDIVQFSFDSKINTILVLTVTDVAGKIVSTQSIEVNSGKNNISVNLSSLANGNYFITASTQTAKIGGTVIKK